MRCVTAKTGARSGRQDASTGSTAITNDEPLHVDEVHHKAFIDVDEAGTEAAAATAVFTKNGAVSPADLRKVTVDHPFLFLLRDHKTGQTLFIGRVASPTL